MKTAAIAEFRRKLADRIPVFGMWITLESPSITEIAVGLGLDWVVIDAEHGHLDWKEILEHIRATVRSDTVALVRLAELNAALVKRVLDIGADGIVIPTVESAEQLKRAIAFAKYPSEGMRGIGAERATGWGQCLTEHTAEANNNVLVVPIIETVRAISEVPAMAAVEGSELFFFGPADFSASAGYRGQWEGPGIAEQIETLKDTLLAAGKHCGILAASNEDIHRRLNRGFRAVGLGMDSGFLLRSLRGALAAVGRDRPMRADFTIAPIAGPAPLPNPPATMRPDRPEVINEVAAAPKVELAGGVNFQCLVGEHNKAKQLTTGQVNFAVEASLPYHTHPFSESITVLRGQIALEVEGRGYQLGPLDNAVIPRGLAHTARNTSPNNSALLHVAMASERPTRVLIDKTFPRRAMPAGALGFASAERINRFLPSPRFAAGPNTAFIDFFNEDLLPGLEMSGGHALFHPGGRLPSHVHDFDESICIIRGTATCVVEGRRYLLKDSATAFVPRGRVHYFINETEEAMEMIWVYAGPKPERIVIDEAWMAKQDGLAV